MPGTLVLSGDERTEKKDLTKNTSEQLRLRCTVEYNSEPKRKLLTPPLQFAGEPKYNRKGNLKAKPTSDAIFFLENFLTLQKSHTFNNQRVRNIFGKLLIP